MIAAGFCQASHAVLYSFGTLTWRAAGIDDVTISLLWGESVAVEIVLMLVSGWLMQRIGVCGLIGLGLACGMVRWTGMAFTTELWALVVLQALHAGTFAACHLGAMAFIQRALPANGVALGQSVYYALGTGATQAVIFQFSGLLYSDVRPARLPRHVGRQRHRHGGDRLLARAGRAGAGGSALKRGIPSVKRACCELRIRALSVSFSASGRVPSPARSRPACRPSRCDRRRRG